MGDVETVAREVHESSAVEHLARWGLVCRGLVYLVVGLLALSVTLGGDERTDKNGALQAIADRPLGELLLVSMVVGFLGYSAWRLLSAAVGHREDDEPKRTGKRLLSLGRGGFYLFIAFSTVRFLVEGQRPQDDRTPGVTARVMEHGGGRTAVFVTGAVVVVVGLGIAVRAARQKQEQRLERYRIPSSLLRPVSVIGVVGLVGRGLVMALLGAFLVKAAVEFEPQEARGLDAALKELSEQAFGRGMLSLAAIGLIGYALWSFIEAAYRRT
jgi:hypothetical protein